MANGRRRRRRQLARQERSLTREIASATGRKKKKGKKGKQTAVSQPNETYPGIPAGEEYKKGSLGYDLTKASEFADKFLGDQLKPLPTLSTDVSPEMQGYINKLSGLAETAGNRSSDISSLLKQGRQFAANAGKRSGDIKDIMSRFKSSLDGYTSAENQALRESAERGIDSQLETQLAGLRSNAARQGIRGGAANLQADELRKERFQLGKELEQDIFLRNADEKQRRLETFGDFTRNVEGDEFDRERGAIADSTTAFQTQETLEDARRGAAYDRFGTALSDKQKFVDDRERFNVDQVASDRAAQTAALLGFTNVLQGRADAKEQKKILQQELR